MCAFRWAGWSWSRACRARANPRWRATCCTPTCARSSARAPPPAGGGRACAARRRAASLACSRWIKRRSGAPHAPARPPTSASGTTSARVFAGTNEARVRGYAASRFSFNTGGGRCPECDGAGTRTIEMSFLPDVKVLCERCGGKRFDRETLEVQWRGRSVGDVLAMNVEEALEFFRRAPAHPPAAATAGRCRPRLPHARPAEPDALGRRGAAHQAGDRAGAPDRFAARATGHTLYVLDEPTVGLHMADVEKLIAVLHRLVDAGHSVVLIEHNLDIMAEADWIIDLGPEAGDDGGRIVAAGPPAAIVARRDALAYWRGAGAASWRRARRAERLRHNCILMAHDLVCWKCGASLAHADAAAVAPRRVRALPRRAARVPHVRRLRPAASPSSVASRPPRRSATRPAPTSAISSRRAPGAYVAADTSAAERARLELEKLFGKKS